jgi:hypothetical protein
VVKNTDFDGTFGYAGSGSGVDPSFSITTTGGTGSKSFTNIPPGTKGVTETAHSGWNLTGSSCDNGNPPSAVNLAAGVTVTCTFTNTVISPGRPSGAPAGTVPLTGVTGARSPSTPAVFAQTSTGSVNGQAVTGSLIGSGTTANGFDIAVYRAPLPAAAIPTGGNGTYALSGFPGGSDGFADGAQIVLVYSNGTLPATTIVINDGLIIIGSDGTVEPGTASTTLTGLGGGATSSARTTYVVADAAPTSGNSASFNGATVATNPFRSTSGQFWDSLTVDVTGRISGGATSATASVTNSGPVYLFWLAQVLAASSQSPTISVTPGAVPPGGTFTLTGGGFTPGETVTCSAVAGGSAVQTTTVVADSAGNIAFSAILPSNLSVGTSVTFTCTGAQSGAVATTVVVVVAAPPPAIPEADVLILFGTGLAGLGGYAAARLRSLRKGPHS